jgi:hypothetical protein
VARESAFLADGELCQSEKPTSGIQRLKFNRLVSLSL